MSSSEPEVKVIKMVLTNFTLKRLLEGEALTADILKGLQVELTYDDGYSNKAPE